MTNSSPADLYSIGRTASVVGISPATLRMWERRYGRPVPVRLPSGHRRFTHAQVQWLKRVAEALSRGTRAAEAVTADAKVLDRLLAEGRSDADVPDAIVRLVRLARSSEGRALADALCDAWSQLGPRPFLCDRVAPLVTELGSAWADGRIEIRHEHLATERIGDALRVLRANLPPCPGGPVLLLTTLPGECHGLGLQMVAILATVEGCAARVLGTQTPLDEIVAAAYEMHAAAVGIGVSLATGGTDTDRMLADLRGRLPGDVRLLVGGAGARGPRRGRRDLDYVTDLHECADWLAELRTAHVGPPA